MNFKQRYKARQLRNAGTVLLDDAHEKDFSSVSDLTVNQTCATSTL